MRRTFGLVYEHKRSLLAATCPPDLSRQAASQCCKDCGHQDTANAMPCSLAYGM